jgi:hypothetical protein
MQQTTSLAGQVSPYLVIFPYLVYIMFNIPPQSKSSLDSDCL